MPSTAVSVGICCADCGEWLLPLSVIAGKSSTNRTSGSAGPVLVAIHSPMGPSGVLSGSVRAMTACSASADSMLTVVPLLVVARNASFKFLPVKVNWVVLPGWQLRGCSELIVV